jgi:hypothetical protein
MLKRREKVQFDDIIKIVCIRRKKRLERINLSQLKSVKKKKTKKKKKKKKICNDGLCIIRLFTQQLYLMKLIWFQFYYLNFKHSFPRLLSNDYLYLSFLLLYLVHGSMCFFHKTKI